MNHKNLNIRQTPIQLMLYCMAFSSFIVFFLTNSQLNFFSESDLTINAQHLILFGLSVLSTATALFCLANINQGPSNPVNDQILPMAAAILSLSSIMATLNFYAMLSEPKMYYLYLFLQTALAYLIVFISTSFLQLRGAWPAYTASISAFSVLTIGLYGTLSQNWINPKETAELFCPAVCLISALTPICALILFSIRQIFSGEKKYWLSLVLLRLKPNPKNGAELRAFVAISVTNLVTFCAWLWLLNLAGPKIKAEWLTVAQALNLSWIGLAFYTRQNITKSWDLRYEQKLTSSLAHPTAKRFLERYPLQRGRLATTVGLKTASFLINHDPDGSTATSLPAGIAQIRNREINRLIDSFIEEAYLFNKTIGSQTFGVIDPETSRHPCVDALCLFAGMHLDAANLVGKRLEAITELLKILDPELSQKFGVKELEKANSRKPWLFNFDYGWIEQELIQTSDFTDFNVTIGNLPATVRLSVFDYLRKKNHLGSFIWIGEKARERLLQEAPLLSTAIQAFPVPVNKGEEILVFVMKLDELIPRLESYYNLSTKRQRLQEFGVSHESTRYLNIIQLQLVQCKRLDGIQKLLADLTSYPWHGFKEKDLALDVILKIYAAGSALLIKEKTKPSKANPELDAFRMTCINACQQIGYPSQILHLAHLNKLAVRNPENLIKRAGQPWHQNFHESWLTLATINLSRFSEEQTVTLAKFLHKLPKHSKLQKNIFVMSKAFDVFSNFCTSAQAKSEVISSTFHNYMNWLIQAKAPLEICLQLLDLRIYLEKQHGIKIELPKSLASGFDAYLGKIRADLGTQAGSSADHISAIDHRWRLKDEILDSAA